MKVNPFDEEVQGALHFIDAMLTQVMKRSSIIIKLSTLRMSFADSGNRSWTDVTEQHEHILEAGMSIFWKQRSIIRFFRIPLGKLHN